MVDVITIIVQSLVIFGLQFLMYLIIVRQLNNALGPVVSKAFGIIGKSSADKAKYGAVKDEMLSSVLDSPRMAALKMGADAIGIDIDGMFEKYGPEKTLQGLLEIAGSLGINPMAILSGGLPQGLSLGTTPNSGENPYLRKR